MIEQTKLDTILADIKNPDVTFSLSRWGDGEWKSVLGRHKAGASNCDGHKFFSGMRQELRNVLLGKPKYRLGMQHFAMRLYGKAIEQFIDEHGLQRLDWVDSDVFHYGAIKGRMDDIVAAAASRRLLVVGPPHMKKLKTTALKYWRYVEVPPKNCYINLQEIYRHTVAAADSQRDKLLISISASMPANILVDMLHKRFEGQHTVVDFGSLWDPLVGVYSRSYMKAARKKKR